MILTEYNEELHIKSEKQISFEEGEARGERIGLVKICQKFKKTKEETVAELMEEFSMTNEEAWGFLEEHWRP